VTPEMNAIATLFLLLSVAGRDDLLHPLAQTRA
jgi:hypothetical protein